MTTSTTGPELIGPAPALTVEDVELVVACPLCGAETGRRCAHVLNRLRAALRLQRELEGRR